MDSIDLGERFRIVDEVGTGVVEYRTMVCNIVAGEKEVKDRKRQKRRTNWARVSK